MTWRRRGLLVTAGIAAAVSLAACSGTPDPDPDPTPDRLPDSSVVLPDETVAPAVDMLEHQTLAEPGQLRLADGLVPPTNTWFSGLVFGETAQPVFPLPLSFGVTDDGFAFGVPSVTTTERVIAGPFNPDVSVSNGGAESLVVAYDAATVTLEQRDAEGEPLGRVTLTRGSPQVSYQALAQHSIALPDAMTQVSESVWGLRLGGTSYGLSAAPGLIAEGGDTLAMQGGDTVVWFAVPDAEPDALAALAPDAIESTRITYRGGANPATRIEYQTAQGEDALFVRMPHQQEESAEDCGLGVFSSVWGELTLCSGTALEWAVPALEPDGSLDFDALTDADRELLAKELAADAADPGVLPADTYYAGKALYRLATLLDLAASLDETAIAERLSGIIADELRLWADPAGCRDREERCFVYDPELRGLVGRLASFGSEEFNDHHFHYGYFLYAAATAVAHNPALLEDIEPVMTLLAADIGSGRGGSFFPAHRNFDPYGGHSWASGFSPFADGNNHESSAEAVMAWNGLALWAGVTDDPALREHAEWMLAGEASSARHYWTDFDLEGPTYDGYGHTIVSLGWGGKREYATWFSDEPTAKLGIQLLPMSPVAGYLGENPERVRANVAEAGTDGPLADYIVMYSALAGQDEAEAALEAATQLPADAIDGGNSRSYLLAFILTQLRN